MSWCIFVREFTVFRNNSPDYLQKMNARTTFNKQKGTRGQLPEQESLPTARTQENTHIHTHT